MSAAPGWLPDARAQLEHGLERPRQELARSLSAHELVRGLVLGTKLMPALAALLVLVWYAASALGPRPPLDPLWLPLLLLLAPVLGGLYLLLRSSERAPDQLATARACSRELRDQDRLAAAAEFAAGAPRSGTFAHAAIEDGLASLDRARALAPRVAGPSRSWSSSLLLAAVVALVPWLLGWPARTASAAAEPTATGPAKPPASPTTAAAESRTQARDTAMTAQRPDTAVAQARAAVARDERERQKPSQQLAAQGQSPSAAGPAGGNAEAGASPSKGKEKRETKEGRSGEASAGASGSEATAQAQEAAQQAKPKAKQPAKKPKEKTPRSEREEQPREGGGSSSGASRSGAKGVPVAGAQRMREAVRDGQQDAADQEEDAEEDDQSSEQRGGAAPLSRDRQKSPARELTISGDGPPRDGRGGPTPPKKARGTASLVLGVVIPDHVHGRPNPGTSKESLADAPPHAEAHALPPVAPTASPVSPHEQSLGLGSDWLTPLVLKYHELWRRAGADNPTNPTEHEQRNR